MIGTIEVGYNRRSDYIYRAVTDISGYFIRKSDWLKLENNHWYFNDNLKKE
jgi:hypothetical protein